MAKFAEGTVVPVARTRGEIEGFVKKYGASQFASGWDAGQAMLQFQMRGRMVRFVVALPSESWARDEIFGRPRCRYWNREQIPEALVTKTIEAEARRRWRCLLLAIKAKLEVVESGISTFDEEFLSRIVIDGLTVWDRVHELDSQGQLLLPPVSP